MLCLCLSPAERRRRVQPAAHAELVEQVHSQIQHYKQISVHFFPIHQPSNPNPSLGFYSPSLLVCWLEWRGREEGRVWSVGSWWNTSTSIRWTAEPIQSSICNKTGLMAPMSDFPLSRVTEKQLFACWLAALPSNGTLSEGQKHFPSFRGLF